MKNRKKGPGNEATAQYADLLYDNTQDCCLDY